MTSFAQRVARPLAFLLAFALVAPVAARTTPAKAPAAKAIVAKAPATPWLYRGSDIPPDREWIFGELANGLRYAVRKNGVPPGQVSIRLAIDAGSLNELKSEAGFAHFNEHLSFRGSKYVPDGEAKRLWRHNWGRWKADHRGRRKHRGRLLSWPAGRNGRRSRPDRSTARPPAKRK